MDEIVRNTGDQLQPKNLGKVLRYDGDWSDIENQWISDNVTSIQETVREEGIRHSTMLYPASGSDILRPLIAYDLDEIDAYDIDKDLQTKIESQILKAGIPIDEVVVHGDLTLIKATINGKLRTIRVFNTDIRFAQETVGAKNTMFFIFIIQQEQIRMLTH